jgi:hypothetical protein
LFGLFDDLKISKKYHLIVAKFNGYQDPYSYMGDRMLINLPDLNEIDMLNGVYRTKNTF